MLTWFRLSSRFKMSINSRSLGDMLLHLLGIFEDLQSFDRTCSKEPDQITVLSDVQQGEVFQCMYPQSSRCVIIDLFDDLLFENMEFCFACKLVLTLITFPANCSTA